MVEKIKRPKKPDSKRFKALASFADSKGTTWPEVPELAQVLQVGSYFMASDLYRALLVRFSPSEDEENFANDPTPKFFPTEIFSKLGASDDALVVIDRWLKTSGYQTPEGLDVSNFPDCVAYNSAIDSSYSACIVCSKEVLKTVLSDCELTLDGAVTFTLKSGSLTISTKSDVLGETVLPLECHLEPLTDDFTVSVNHKYVKQALTVLNSDEIVLKFIFDSADDPAWVLKLQGETDESIAFIALINPNKELEDA